MHNKKSDYIPYLFGGLIGAFIGLLAVYLIENSNDKAAKRILDFIKPISRSLQPK